MQLAVIGLIFLTIGALADSTSSLNQLNSVRFIRFLWFLIRFFLRLTTVIKLVHKFPFLNAAPHVHHQENDRHHNHHDLHENLFGDLFSEFQSLPIHAVWELQFSFKVRYQKQDGRFDPGSVFFLISDLMSHNLWPTRLKIKKTDW